RGAVGPAGAARLRGGAAGARRRGGRRGGGGARPRGADRPARGLAARAARARRGRRHRVRRRPGRRLAADRALALRPQPAVRRVALVVLAPAAALVALAALDLATGGDSHFTRTVLRAGDRTALEDVIARRYELAFHVLLRPAMLVLTPLALAAIVFGVRRRRELSRGVPGAPLWGAALGGAAAAGVAGALFNDSGPLLLVFSVFVAAWVAAYLRAGVGRSSDG